VRDRRKRLTTLADGPALQFGDAILGDDHVDLADDLIAWNQNPTVAGGMSITGDSICMFG